MLAKQWCKGSKSLLSGRFGYPYWRPGDSFCIRETPGLSVRVGMYVSGKKKLRIQKYPDTCGRGLRKNMNENPLHGRGKGETTRLLVSQECVPGPVPRLSAIGGLS